MWTRPDVFDMRGGASGVSIWASVVCFHLHMQQRHVVTAGYV
jgi:hypothetical protein